MEKGRWVTLGSRSRGRRQRRKKSASQQFEQNESSKSQKSKQSANTPPPMAFPPREKKVSEKPTFTNEENEISKIFNRALEDSAKRALEPIARQVDPAPTHRSPMAVKTMDYPKKSFWKKGKTQDSKNRKKKGTLTEQVSCGSTDVSDSSSQHSEVNNINNSTTTKEKRATPEKIKMQWIFEQNPVPSGKGSTIPSTTTTPHAKRELKSWPKVKKNWPKIKKANSMPNLNPYAPSFQVNPWASSFKSFTPRPASAVPWQPMPQQSMINPWRSQYPVFNSYPSLPPQQIQHNNGIRNDNRDSVSNLLLPYSCGPY